MRENVKRKCNQLTDLMEECFDENNPEDGKTFDQRLAEKLNENDELKLFFIQNNLFK